MKEGKMEGKEGGREEIGGGGRKEGKQNRQHGKPMYTRVYMHESTYALIYDRTETKNIEHINKPEWFIYLFKNVVPCYKKITIP